MTTPCCYPSRLTLRPRLLSASPRTRFSGPFIANAQAQALGAHSVLRSPSQLSDSALLRSLKRRPLIARHSSGLSGSSEVAAGETGTSGNGSSASVQSVDGARTAAESAQPKGVDHAVRQQKPDLPQENGSKGPSHHHSVPPQSEPSTSGASSSHTVAPDTPPKGAAAESPSLLTVVLKTVNRLRPLIETVILLAVWYASNIFYNIYNKQVLQVFPYATTCTCIHIVVAIAMVSMLWVLRIKPVPAFTERSALRVLPLSLLHLAGFLTTNMSLGAVNVSLTHTIKSLEPFFTVLLSLFFFGTLPALPVLLTLVPIVAGVIVASATDLSFNWYGFMTAMGSNVAFQSRNVLSKKYMVESSLESLEGSMKPNEVLDEVDLFLCISIMALPLALPVVMAVDGATLTARFTEAAAAGGNLATCAGAVMPADVMVKNLLAGACRTADVFASYGLLSRLNPVTHSVANCVKRVVVIAVSIIFFKTQSSYLNILGTVLALGGVFAYSMAERMSPKRPKSLPGQVPRSMSSRLGSWLQALFWSLVPTFIKDALREQEERALEAKAKALIEEAEAKARAKAEQEARDREAGKGEPDYFL